MEQTETYTIEEEKKFYSKRAILIATAGGSPIAGCILFWRNFKNLNQPKEAVYSLIIGIVGTLILLGILASIEVEPVFEKLFNVIIPIIDALIANQLYNKYFKVRLDEHETNGGKFYSAWRASGIALIIVVIIVVIAFIAFLGMDLFTSSNPYTYSNTPTLESKLIEYRMHENAALDLYMVIKFSSKEDINIFIKEEGIPRWKICLQTLNDIEDLSGISIDEWQIDERKTYCKKQIEVYKLTAKLLYETDTELNNELFKLNMEIEALQEDIKSISF